MRENNATRVDYKKSMRLISIVLGMLFGIAVLIGTSDASAKSCTGSLFCPTGIAAAIESAASLPKLPLEWRVVPKPLNLDHMFPAVKTSAK